MILNMSFSGGGATVDKISYTGGRLKTSITSNGKNYTLYTFVTSGTLTIKGELKNTDIWLCGGGANGSSNGYGGGGGYCAELDAQTLLSGNYNITVGGVAEASSFDELLSANGANGQNGGTGGGAIKYSNAGTGDGISKYPFGDTLNFKCHCAGGAAGGADYTNYYGDSYYWHGGNGGTNGSNGGASNSNNVRGGTGGDYGGGNGGNGSSSGMNGYDGTYYGAGGGGAGQSGGGEGQYTWDSGNYGKGYQGVVYLRIPV